MKKKIFSAVIESKMYKEEKPELGFVWHCVDCSCTSKYRRNVARHIESKHIQSPGYNCEICGKFCITSNSLQTHKSTYHKGFSLVTPKPLL